MRARRHKKIIGSAILMVSLITGIVLVSTLAVGWNQSAALHAFLGERYLDALDYDQAVAAFEAAISIDPKNEDTYIRLAETYEKMGMEAKAAETMRNGYVATGSRELKLMAEEDYEIDVTKSFVSLETEDKVVIRQTGLDICFVIDTTGSMMDAINNAKDNMEQIVNQISQKSSDYRVAIVDFRDFSSRSGDSADYPAKLQLNFSSEMDQIQAGIDGLSIGYGGDSEETVYSGLMLAASLEWRADAQHIVILIGDAGPLSPEPISGYTYEDVVEAFRTGEVDLDSMLYEAHSGYGEEIISDAVAVSAFGAADATVVNLAAWGGAPAKEEEVPAAEDAEGEEAPKEVFNINLYGIVTNDSRSTKDKFSSLCDNMGGSVSSIESGSTLSEEICSVIEQVEVVPVSRDAAVNFGSEYSNKEIMVYQGGQIINSVSLGASGKGTLEDMPFGTYLWKEADSGAFGYVTVSADEEKAKLTTEREPYAERIVMMEWIAGASVSCAILIAASLLVVTGRVKKKKAEMQPSL